MTKFIRNVNAYIEKMKIKQNYLSEISGIEKNKLSRILNGTQEENGSDIEKLSDALGRKTEFFLSDSFCVPDINGFAPNKIAFYAGNPTKNQEKIATQLVELMENIDQVMSARSRFINIARM